MMTEKLASDVASEGNLELLKAVRNQGCPWNERTCAQAALVGHLDILVWAREHGCPWDKMVTRAFATLG